MGHKLWLIGTIIFTYVISRTNVPQKCFKKFFVTLFQRNLTKWPQIETRVQGLTGLKFRLWSETSARVQKMILSFWKLTCERFWYVFSDSMKLKILFDTSHKHMVVRQCAFSNGEPDLHYVEIVSYSKDTRIVYFLLLRTHQLKMGSNWVKMRSIFGRKFHRLKSVHFQSTSVQFRSVRQLSPDSVTNYMYRNNRLQNYSKMQHKLYYFALMRKENHFYTDFTDKSHARLSV